MRVQTCELIIQNSTLLIKLGVFLEENFKEQYYFTNHCEDR